MVGCLYAFGVAKPRVWFPAVLYFRKKKKKGPVEFPQGMVMSYEQWFFLDKK